MPADPDSVSPPRSAESPDRETSIAAFVRARRQANGLTQRQLADLAGVGPRAVWDLERGKPTLRMDVANAVLAVFGKRLGLEELPREELIDDPDEDSDTGFEPRSMGGSKGNSKGNSKDRFEDDLE